MRMTQLAALAAVLAACGSGTDPMPADSSSPEPVATAPQGEDPDGPMLTPAPAPTAPPPVAAAPAPITPSPAPTPTPPAPAPVSAPEPAPAPAPEPPGPVVSVLSCEHLGQTGVTMSEFDLRDGVVHQDGQPTILQTQPPNEYAQVTTRGTTETTTWAILYQYPAGGYASGSFTATNAEQRVTRAETTTRGRQTVCTEPAAS